MYIKITIQRNVSKFNFETTVHSLHVLLICVPVYSSCISASCSPSRPRIFFNFANSLGAFFFRLMARIFLLRLLLILFAILIFQICKSYNKYHSIKISKYLYVVLTKEMKNMYICKAKIGLLRLTLYS